MTVCFFFDRINYMNSKKGRSEKIWSIQCILRSIHDSASIFLGKSCMVDSDKGESQNKHTKEGGIKKKKC